MSEEESCTHFFQSEIQNLRTGNALNLNQAKVHFYEIYKRITTNPQQFQKNGFCFNLIGDLLQIIKPYFSKIEENSVETLKGLVSLTNLLLLFNAKDCHYLIDSNNSVLKAVSKVYSQENNSIECDYQALALIAMILQNFEKDLEEEQKNVIDLEIWLSKKFLVKFINFDFEEFFEANANKKTQIVQILALISQFISQQKNKLKENRQLNQFKQFLMKLLMECKNQKALQSALYALCQISSEIKFNEKEVLKHRLIEILMENVEQNSGKFVIFGSLKLLKAIWRQNIRRSAILKQGIVTRLFNVYGLQPQIVFCFIEEIFSTEWKKLLEDHPEFINLMFEMMKRERNDTALQTVNLLSKKLGVCNVQQVLKILGQGLLNYIFQFQQSKTLNNNNLSLKSAIFEYFDNYLLNSSSFYSHKQQSDTSFLNNQAQQQYFSNFSADHQNKSTQNKIVFEQERQKL